LKNFRNENGENLIIPFVRSILLFAYFCVVQTYLYTILSVEVGGTCGTHGGVKRFCKVLVGRPEEKRPLERPRRSWEDNIGMNLRETGIDEANWIRLAQYRVQWRAFVSTVMNFPVP
jgi:hypothetical protein